MVMAVRVSPRYAEQMFRNVVGVSAALAEALVDTLKTDAPGIRVADMFELLWAMEHAWEEIEFGELAELDLDVDESDCVEAAVYAKPKRRRRRPLQLVVDNM